MEQHPIPQNISSYEFRLVGDMTLKQFFQLSSGIIVGLVIYRLPLINILKFPLIFIAVVIGIALAFIPINNRPFSRWIVAFIRAIYSPTEYTWQLSAVSPAAVLSQPKEEAGPPVVTVIAPVTPVPSPSGAEALAKAPPPPTKSPTETTYIQAVATPPSPSGAETPAKAPPTTVFTSAPSPSGAETPAKAPPTTPPVVILPSVSSPVAKPKTIPSPLKAAPIASQLTPPSIPNILSGLITDPAGNPLDTTIVEIIDSGSGIPARALRSNRLGQFQIATPLKPGNYSITAEKDGFSFEPVSLSVANQIINPIILTGFAV